MHVSRMGFRLASLVGVAMWLAGGSVARARLGETLAQIQARFGKGAHNPLVWVGFESPLKPDFYAFGKDGVSIYTYFWRGTCGRVIYVKPQQNFTEDDLMELLKANGGLWIEEKNPTWDLVKNRKAQRMWRREDNKAWAELRSSSRLELVTFDWLAAERDVEAQKARDATTPKKLKGF